MEERLPSRRKRNAAIFVPLAALWLVLDIATKAYFNGFSVGQVVAGPFLGLVQFRLVHNTGAAWGMFDESTFALGVMSVLVCVALTVYLFTAGKRAGVMETVGIALIVAGGLGNALDRFTLGYVVDFIDTVFSGSDVRFNRSDNRCYLSSFDQRLHFPKARTIKGRAADSVVHKILWMQIAVLLGVIHQNDLLRWDLSRIFSANNMQCC